MLSGVFGISQANLQTGRLYKNRDYNLTGYIGNEGQGYTYLLKQPVESTTDFTRKEGENYDLQNTTN